MTIKIPFSQQIYDSESDQVHNVRILENDSKKDRRRFRYILFIGYQDPVGMKLETLPENEEVLKRLLAHCIKANAIEAEKEEKRYQEVVSLIGTINHFLNDFSEGIPAERVTGDHSYKVSGSWFGKAFSLCRFVLELYLPAHNQLSEEIDNFFQLYGQKRWNAADATIKGERVDSFVKTTKEEIDTMNSLLQKVKEQLEVEFDLDDEL